VRERWLSAPGWRDAFEGLLSLRQLSLRDLTALVPAVHWPGARCGELPCALDRDGAIVGGGSVRVDAAAYRGACGALAAAAAALEDCHLELCALLAATPTLLTGARPGATGMRAARPEPASWVMRSQLQGTGRASGVRAVCMKDEASPSNDVC